MSDNITSKNRVNNNIAQIDQGMDEWEASPGLLEPGFVMLPNRLFSGQYKLSVEALGMLCYLLHHKRGFKIHDSTIMRLFGMGHDKKRRIFTELRDKGFMKKVRTRDPRNGLITGCRAMYSNHPEFLKPTQDQASIHKSGNPTDGQTLPMDNPSVGGPVPEDNPALGQPDPLTILGLNNTGSSQDQDLIKTTTLGVVVGLDILMNVGFKELDARELLLRHGIDRVRKIVAECKKSPRIENPIGWIRAGLEKGWLSEGQKNAVTAPTANLFYTREENIAFFKKCSEDEKLALYDRVSGNAPFCYEPKVLKREDVLTDGFCENPWFYAFMSILGRQEVTNG